MATRTEEKVDVVVIIGHEMRGTEKFNSDSMQLVAELDLVCHKMIFLRSRQNLLSFMTAERLKNQARIAE